MPMEHLTHSTHLGLAEAFTNTAILAGVNVEF